MRQGLQDLLPHARELVACYFPGWERIYTYADLQHGCCEHLGSLSHGCKVSFASSNSRHSTCSRAITVIAMRRMVVVMLPGLVVTT